jgi:hypothetical protein
MLRRRSKRPTTQRQEAVALMARAVTPLRDPVSVSALACATAVWASSHLDGQSSWHTTTQHAADLALASVGAFKDSVFEPDRLRPLGAYIRALRPLLDDQSIPAHDRLIGYAVF